MSVLGIDFGSSNCVLATVARGAVSIIRNELSDRLTPSLVSFTDKERLIGDPALSQIISNYRNTCRGFKNLLGRSFEDPDLNMEELYALAPFAPAENGTVGFQVTYKGESRVVNASVATAALLTKLRQTAEKSTGVLAVDIVIACPGWFTDVNRRALLAATQIAGLNCRRVMSENTATALDYGIYRSREFEENKSYYVVFVAMGHSNSSVTVVEFLKCSLKILSEVNYRDLGGRNMDTAIAHHFAEFFKNQHGLDCMKNVKTRLKVEEQASKLKKVLSANNDAQFHIECLMNDFDCTGTMTREQFQSICAQNIIPRFQNLLKDAMQKSGISVEKVNAIEMVGGCTRIPWLQNVVSNFFGKLASKTLSADECVARGCALQAAMCSSAYKVREFSCWERTFHPIAVGWDCSTNENSGGKTDADFPIAKSPAAASLHSESKSAVVIEAGMVSNVVKKLFFERAANFDVWAFYAQPQTLPPGTSPHLNKCRVIVPKKEDGLNHTIALRCKLNYHGIFRFDKAEIIETEEVEEITMQRRPVEPCASPPSPLSMDTNMIAAENEKQNLDANNLNEPQNLDPEYKEVEVRRKAKRTKKTELQIIITENPINLTEKQIAEMREAELFMECDDRTHAETKEKMNELEAYIYYMRSKVFNGEFKPYIQPDQAEEFAKALDKAEEWLYENAEAMKSSFCQKLADLQFVGGPIERRFEKHQQRNESIEKALQFIQHQKSFASNTEDKYAHMIQEKQQILYEANLLETALEELVSKQNSIPLYEEGIFTSEEINEKAKAFCNLVNKIMSKPKHVSPRPTSVPPNSCEPAGGGNIPTVETYPHNDENSDTQNNAN